MNSDLLSEYPPNPRRPLIRNVTSGRLDRPVAEATRLMLDNDISRLPVVNEARRLVGILTERDPLRRSATEPSGTARAGSKYWCDPVEWRARTPLDKIVRLTKQTGAGARR